LPLEPWSPKVFLQVPSFGVFLLGSLGNETSKRDKGTVVVSKKPNR